MVRFKRAHFDMLAARRSLPYAYFVFFHIFELIRDVWIEKIL